jgi:hypothetical protein
MKKTDIQIQTPTKQEKLYQGTQGNPKEHTERRNPTSNNENFIEMLLNMINQNAQEVLKNSKKAKMKNMRKQKNK